MTLATIVGLFFTLIILLVILFSVAGSITDSEKSYKIEDNSLLKISLSGKIAEQSVENPFNFSIPGVPLETETENQGLDDILCAIKKAKDCPQIKGIYIESKTLDAGFVTSEEIRDALTDFKKSGKYIIAYGDNFDKREYFISTVADKVFLNPEGLMNFGGLASTPVFYKKAMDKIGVKMEIFRVGTFKSAVEPFTSTEMSKESRMQTSEFLNGIWNHMLSKISESRGISIENLNRIADKNTLFESAKEMVSLKLVDSLLYKSEVLNHLSKIHGVKDYNDLKVVSVTDLITVPDKDVKYGQDKIAVLYAEGEIYDSGSEGIVSGKLIKEIEDIKKDDKIKAVVLRVNSPGGSAFASEQIWKALADLKKTRPLVVSMGDYAASGGYYISSCANKIIASDNTLTGSIGIFGTFPIIDGLTNKIGIDFDVVKTNELSDIGNLTRPMTNLEKAKIQKYIERSYDLFIDRCAAGRNMDRKNILEIAQGRVWTGAKAVKLGLVDETGGLNKAIDAAAKLGKAKNYRLVYYPSKKNFLTMFMEEFSSQTKMKIALKFLGEDYTDLIKLKKSNIQTGVLALMEGFTID